MARRNASVSQPKAAAQKYTVLVADPVAEQGLKLLRAHPAFRVEVRTGLGAPELKKALAESDALIIRSETRVSADVLPANGRLKVIGRAGVGVDNVDVPAATRQGILVMNAPEGNTLAAAEHTLAMILALSRNVPRANASLRAGEWKRSKFVGHELYGEVLGIVGMGRIGAEVAKRARAFGMTVVCADPLITAERATELGVELVPLAGIFARVDILTLHAPLMPATRHLVNAATLRQMRKGAFLINCARGGLVDEGALAKSIQEGHLGGAAIDVFESEPPAASNPLLKLDQVVTTPHLGASTHEAQVNVSTVIAEQVRDYLISGLVRNAVNAPATAPEALSELAPYLGLVERMGRFLIQLTDGAPRQIALEYSGDIAKRNLAMLTAAAVKGLLSIALNERVNLVNALALAKERGIEVTESKSSLAREFSSLARMTLVTEKERRSMEGTVIGRDEPHVVAIDGLHLDIVPEGVMITFSNVDRPGIVGKVGMILGRAKINIAGLHLGRIAVGRRAVSIFSVDNAVPPKVVQELSSLKELLDVRIVTI